MPTLRYLPALLPLAAPALAQTTAPAPHTILVRGAAERELDPERLDVLMTYRYADNVKDSERTQDQEAALREVVRRAGIAEDKLMLEELSASGYGGFSKVGNTNVAVTKTYRLTLDDPRQLATLVPQLVQTGADNLRVVNLTSSREDAAKAELTAQAAADARQKAAVAVQAVGGQLGAVLTMVEVLPGQAYAPQAAEGAYRLKAEQYQGRLSEPVPLATPTLRKIRMQVRYDVVFEVKP